MFVGIVIFAVIILVISISRIKKVNNEYFSEAKMDEMARIAAEKATKNVTKITCDYCGMVIDITAERVCPHCGATYGNDEEFLGRNKIDEELRDKEYKLAYERAKEQAKRKNRQSYKVIRSFIIVSAIVAAVFLVPLIIFLTRESVFNNVSKIINGSYISDYISDDGGSVYIDGKDISDLKDHVSGFISAAKDQVSDIISAANGNADAGTGVQDYVFKNTEIVEDENMSVYFGTISVDEYGNFMISVQMNNKTSELLYFTFDLSSINRKNNWGFFYESVEAGKSLTKDFGIINFSWDSEYTPLKEIVLQNISYYSISNGIYSSNDGPLCFETTADYVIPKPVIMGQVIYQHINEGITLSVEKITGKDCMLYFTNTGNNNYRIESSSTTVNGVETFGTTYNEILLANSQYSYEPASYFDPSLKPPYDYAETFVLTDINTGNTIIIDNLHLVIEDDNY